MRASGTEKGQNIVEKTLDNAVRRVSRNPEIVKKRRHNIDAHKTDVKNDIPENMKNISAKDVNDAVGCTEDTNMIMRIVKKSMDVMGGIMGALNPLHFLRKNKVGEGSDEEKLPSTLNAMKQAFQNLRSGGGSPDEPKAEEPIKGSETASTGDKPTEEPKDNKPKTEEPAIPEDPKVIEAKDAAQKGRTNPEDRKQAMDVLFQDASAESVDNIIESFEHGWGALDSRRKDNPKAFIAVLGDLEAQDEGQAVNITEKLTQIRSRVRTSKHIVPAMQKEILNALEGALEKMDGAISDETKTAIALQKRLNAHDAMSEILEDSSIVFDMEGAKKAIARKDKADAPSQRTQDVDDMRDQQSHCQKG